MKDVTLTLNGSAQAIVVRGDERRLRQIVWNLVTNAVKFTNPGGRVELVIAAQGSMASVEVKDTGRGVLRGDSAGAPGRRRDHLTPG